MSSVTLCDGTYFHGYAACASLWSNEVWLLQSQIFMNHSGPAVVALARFCKVMPGGILVAHDGLDLPPGTVKLELGGGSGGHNDLRDIAAHLTTQQFWRLHPGIGHPYSLLPPDTTASGQYNITNFVPKVPRKEERDFIGRAIDQGPDALPELIASDARRATIHLHTAH